MSIFQKEYVTLQKQNLDIVKCEDCGEKMVNIDADKLVAGDLATLKRLNILVSNPNTNEQICVHCEVKKPKPSQSVSDWYKSPSHDDSSFWGGGSIGGGSSINIGGGFGGFGGGGFSGGGASGGF